MSGPGAYEPPEEYVPAAIEGVIDEKALPTEPAAGEDELWLVQVPGDVNPADFQGLRFKLTGEGAGADVAAFKAGGKKYRLVEEDANVASGMFVLPPVKPAGGSKGKGGGAEFGAALPLTRRLTLTRRSKGVGGGDGDDDVVGGGDGGKTPGEKKEKKRKKDKGDKEAKSAKKAKK